jgi:hypothetical protein
MFDKIKKITNETTVSLQDKVTNNLNIAKETTVSLQDKVANNLKDGLKLQIIKQAANINYNVISSSIKALDKGGSIPQSIILSIDLLQKATDEYNRSENPNRDDEFLNYLINNIDAGLVLETLAPFIKQIPYGGIIVMVLKLIVKYKLS